MIGKWHLQNDPTGFDYWNILPGQGAVSRPRFIETGERKKHTGYCTDLIGDFTLDWLKQRDPNKPFFLMCHHKAPHRPWQPDAEIRKMFDDADSPGARSISTTTTKATPQSVAAVKMKVGENITKTDLKRDIAAGPEGRRAAQVGLPVLHQGLPALHAERGRQRRPRARLSRRRRLASNTIVIYTSDQGFFLGDHGFFDKRLMYEESLRMPFLMRYPAAIKRGYGEFAI